MSEPALQLEHVTVAFGGVLALNDVSLRIGQDQVVGLIGPNGAGKSTLLNVTSGLIAPQRGSVRLGGRDMRRVRPAERARSGIGRTFQTPSLFDGLTAVQAVQIAGRQTRRGRCDRSTGLELLAFVGMMAVADRPTERLTLYERRCVELAKALALTPRVMLMDEPSTGLRAVEVVNLRAIVGRLSGQFGVATLVVSNDVGFVQDACDQVAVLDYGRLIAFGAPGEVRANEEVIAAYFGKEA